LRAAENKKSIRGKSFRKDWFFLKGVMSHPDNNFYGFGDFRLDAAERALYHAENLVPLTPKAIETLLVLVRHAGHIVGKEELIQAVWPDTFVEEGNLNVNIFALRKALGERTGEQSFIETVPRRGYRFVVPVQLAERNGEALIIERRTRARIVTEVEDDSDAAPSSAAALEVPWQGEDRRRTTPLVRGEPAAALPTAKTAQFPRWLLLACAFVASVVLFAAGRWYLSSRPGVPVRVNLAGKKLIAWDARNRVTWEYEFSQPVELQPVLGAEAVTFSDIDGDGQSEALVLLNLLPQHPDATQPEPAAGAPPFKRTSLYCFSSKGQVLWSYWPDLKLSFAGHIFEGPWKASAMLITPTGTAQSIWMAYGHHTWWPSFLVRVDFRGGAELKYISSGAILSLGHVQNTNGSYILAGGINNGYKAAMLSIIDENAPLTASPQSSGTYRYDESAEGPYKLFLFPPSELFRLQGESFHGVGALRVSDTRIEVQTYEGKEPSQSFVSIGAFYEFNKAFELVSVSLADTYWAAHQRYEREGKIHHTASQCPDRSLATRVRIWTANENWSDSAASPVPKVN
jgi:DNA-binding winged helix-turn-helix (wHTH) protein